MARQYATLKERFWQKVNKCGIDDCWEWTACKYANLLYGAILAEGKKKLAHRVSWELNNGEIPEGLCVLHKCDNPICVNPNHLFLGTHLDNSRDRDAKGRHVACDQRGEKGPRSKLTNKEAHEIKILTKHGALTQWIIGDMYNVVQSRISAIKAGRTYCE